MIGTTVSRYRILSKLGASTRAEAAIEAHRLGLVEAT